MIFLENKKYMKSSFLEEFFVLINWNELLDIEVIVSNNPKGRISKRVFQENKARQIFRKTNISYPLIRTLRTGVSIKESTPNFPKSKHFLRACAYQGVRNVRFREIWSKICFLETPVSRFALLPYYRRKSYCHETVSFFMDLVNV